MKLSLPATAFRWGVLVFLLTSCATGFAQTLTGTYTLPGTVNGQNIDNLTKLAALLNNAANPVSGNVVFEFGTTYNAGAEVFPITFNAFSGTGNVTVRPATGATLVTAGSNTTGSIVLLNGTSRLTVDGRPGGNGTAIGWTFRNTALAGTQPTFQFTGATNDTLQYLQIEGQNISSTSGTVFLSGGGNRYITLRNNTITHYASGSRTPANAIYASGTTANPNSYNSVLDNHISNFTPGLNYPATGVTVSGTGLNTNYGDNWTISGNNFFRTANETYAAQYIFINFRGGNGSANNVISNNYIGGIAPLATGTLITAVSGVNAFTGISITASNTTISNNTIQNVSLTGTSGASAVGILLANGTTTTNTYTVSGNTVNNIQNAGQWGVTGIYNDGAGNININGNTVSNLTSSNAVNTAAKTVGIYTNSGLNTVTNNTVFNLSSATGTGSSTNVATDAASTGIMMNSFLSVVQTVSNNTIYNISSSQPSATHVRLYGIYFNGIISSASVHVISKNLVYNIYGHASNPHTSPSGIKLRSGRCDITNNVVALGQRADGSSITVAANLNGIMDSSTGSNNMVVNVWHNSVYIGGTGVTGTGSSYAFRRFESNISPSNEENIRNNIFVNNRSNSTGTGKHYSIFLDRTTSVTSNYNVLYGTGTGYTAANTSATDYATLSAWTSGTALDGNSLAQNPQYVDPTATTPDLHISNNPSISPVDQAGINIASVVDDKDGTSRSASTPTDIGAYVVCGSGTPPTVTLTATATTICAGNSVTFTATPSAGGASGNYNFIRNGVSVQNGTSNTYTTTTLANNDSVRVIFSTTASCVSPAPVSSSTITMTVNPSVTPTVILSISPNNVCAGTAITFTATASNGGTSPTFTFIRNGASVQTGATNTYTASNFNNNDSVRVVLTSNAACATTTTSTVSPIIVVIKPNATTTLNQTVCFGDSYLGYNTTGTHRDTFTAANGCDSIRVLNLTVRPQNVTNLTRSICQGQSFEGYTATGNYTDVFTDANGCDSTRILNLTVSNLIQTTINQTICFGDSYLGYTTTGIHRDTFVTGGGCDSVRTLNLTIRPQNTRTVVQSICQGQSFEGYTATGIYRDTLADANGCDSIRILDLTVGSTIQTNLTETICFGDSYLGYNTTGIHRDTFPSGSGCDSIRVLDLTVRPQNAQTLVQSICQGQTFEGYNTTGIYRDTLTGANGCDSIRIINLTVASTINTSANVSICQGDSYQGHTATGSYSDTLTAIGGCDSIHTLNLTVVDYPVAPAITATNNVLGVPDNFDAYQWYLDGVLLTGAEADTLQATANGNYTVVVTNGPGCSDTSAIFNVTGIGIGETVADWNVKLYPNPTAGNVYLTWNGTVEVRWAVYNALGQEISSGMATAATEIDLSNQAEGAYYIRIATDSGILTKKLVLAR